MKLFRILCLLTITTVSFAAVGADRPNILFIYTDDHSHRAVGCYPESYDWVRTPNIDSLASTGVRFSHCYTGTWCMPSRATMLTGHLQTGVESMRMEGEYPASVYDPAKCPFWPRVFRANGYVTAQLGKWHTGVDNGFGRDWDHQKVWNRPAFPENAGNYFYDQWIQTNGTEKETVEGYATDNYTDWAVDFINGKNRDPEKPWYLWVCYGAVHGPFTPAKRHFETYPGVTVPVPTDIYPPREGKPAYSREWNEWTPGEDGYPVLGNSRGQRTVTPNMIHGNRLDQWVRQYHQGVIAIDEGVGRMLQALEKTGQRDNTLVVFTADQGFAWGQHGFRRKLAPYDATIRGPLIFNFPGKIKEGAVCEVPVGGQHIPPTFFEAAGLELPWKMHGSSVMPLLKNPGAEWDEPVLMVYTGQMYGSDTDTVPTDPAVLSPGGVPWWISLTKGHYKYIRTLVDGEVEELYNLKEDPEELVNLARDKRHRERVVAMRKRAVEELRKQGAGMAETLPKVAALPE